MEEKNEKKITGGRGDNNGLSRREWLIDIGRAAALAGIAGPLEADALAGATVPETNPETLPPGLYRPSFDHLGHALGNDSPFHPVPTGCEVDFIRPRNDPYEPQFFSRDEYKVIRRLTALMLGESGNAPEENSKPSNENTVDEVAEWVDLRAYSFVGVREAAERLTPEQVALAEAYNGARLLHRIESTDPPKAYRAGLAWIAEESARRYQRDFLGLTQEQQTAILDAISDDHAERDSENDGTRFFRQIKSDIISGFYTSRIGLKELDDKANRFYAESPGCPSSSANRPKPRR
jgi:Gluconate 2-dehydrogenase subunit 3